MSQPLTLNVLAVCIAVLAAALTGLATTWLSVLGGVSLPNAIVRGGVAFGGTVTVELLILSFLLGH